jgi:glycosyltransferase involved in cell wall biosynthesis
VLYFPNWADPVPAQVFAEAVTEVPLKPGGFNVMFAGNIGEAQDFPAILAAAKQLKDHAHIRWLIVGDGRMGPWVATEIERLGLQDQVIMLGRYPSTRMPSFFEHADVLLVSLKDEPIFSMTVPSKLQSYLAAGKPVVAMLNGEGSALVRASGAGLTCGAGDHEALANAVLELSQMRKEDREAMGRNGLSVNAREFDRKILIDRFEDWIGQVAASAGATSASVRR